MLRGVRSARQFAREAALAQAWETAAFSNLAQHGKLDALDHYLTRVRPARRKSAAEVLQLFRDLAAQGAEIAITETTTALPGD